MGSEHMAQHKYIGKSRTFVGEDRRYGCRGRAVDGNEWLVR
jgi:hypothetical protein